MLLSIVFLFFANNHYINFFTESITENANYGTPSKGVYYWQHFIICGVAGFLLLTTLGILISYKLFGADVKDRVLINQLLLPLSRIEIIISKIIVLILCVVSICIVSIIMVPFLFESIGFLYYSFGDDKNASFYYGTMILNYLNFISVMLLISLIFASFYVLIPKTLWSNWISAIVFLIFAQASFSYFIYFSLIDTMQPNNFHSIFRFFSPFILINQNLTFIKPDIPSNLPPGDFIFSYNLGSYDLSSNGWKIPLGILIASGLSFPIVWRFNTENLAL